MCFGVGRGRYAKAAIRRTTLHLRHNLFPSFVSDLSILEAFNTNNRCNFSNQQQVSCWLFVVYS